MSGGLLSVEAPVVSERMLLEAGIVVGARPPRPSAAATTAMAAAVVAVAGVDSV